MNGGSEAGRCVFQDAVKLFGSETNPKVSTGPIRISIVTGMETPYRMTVSPASAPRTLPRLWNPTSQHDGERRRGKTVDSADSQRTR